MHTERLYYEHNDFAWKVVLPEALIKLYMVVNGVEGRAEAEERMAKTPWKCPSSQ